MRRIGGGSVRPMFGAGRAAVERQPAERAFEEGIWTVAAGRLAAAGVQVGLIALDRANHAADAIDPRELVYQRRDAGPAAAIVTADERAAAEGGVAAPTQVEVAHPHAAWSELTGSHHRRAEAARGAQQVERGGGREQLLDRRRRSHGAGPLGEHQLPGGEVIDVGTGPRPGECELMREVGLQPGLLTGGARGGGGDGAAGARARAGRKQRTKA